MAVDVGVGYAGRGNREGGGGDKGGEAWEPNG